MVISIANQKGGVGKTTTATNLAAAITGHYGLRTLVFDLDPQADATAAGLVIGRAPDGTLTHYGIVGWLAVAFTLLCIWLVHRIRIVGDRPAVGAPGASG